MGGNEWMLWSGWCGAQQGEWCGWLMVEVWSGCGCVMGWDGWQGTGGKAVRRHCQCVWEEQEQRRSGNKCVWFLVSRQGMGSTGWWWLFWCA